MNGLRKLKSVMGRSIHVTTRIDLARVRANAIAISRLTQTPMIAVIKADGYGLGAAEIAEAIADLVEGFCVFSIAEAIEAQIWRRTAKPCLALGPDAGAGVDDYLKHHVRPSVWTVERAAALRQAAPAVSVDTGMQRFSCPAEQIEAVIAAGACTEAFTHATTLQRVAILLDRAGNRGLKLHAAGSSLLAEPTARLDAVRPGIALYRGAARVFTHLVDERGALGPAGYSGFVAERHGIILAGYSNGLRKGPCSINGRRSKILEVGMQSSYVQTADGDGIGDEVILLGDGLSEAEVAREWNTSEHEVLTRLAGIGRRIYP